MPLDPATEKRIRDEAAKRGADPDKAVARAEELAAKKQPSGDAGDASAKGEHPLFDRMLLGALPFVRVREFRSIWLGLDERIPDDDMMCGDFAAKHGGGAGSPAPTDAEATP